MERRRVLPHVLLDGPGGTSYRESAPTASSAAFQAVVSPVFNRRIISGQSVAAQPRREARPPRSCRCQPLFATLIAVCLLATLSQAAELAFDFAADSPGQPPRDFVAAVTGDGPPADWRVIDDPVETPPGLPPSSVTVRHPVLAQLSTDPTDERFPLLVYQPLVFGDFTMTTRFKTVAGAIERMAGIAFRYQDEKNYYVVRASSLGNTFVFYKFVDGIRGNPIGVQTDIPTNTWHELTVECSGNVIRCRLNGRDLFPALTDNSFAEGKIGFWTKSDSVSYFRDTRIVYTPKEPPAKALVSQVMSRYPRLVGIKICAPSTPGALPLILASNLPEEVGKPGNDVDRDVLVQGAIFYGKDKKVSEVAMPLRDRNGEPIASVRILLDRFPGQTEANAIARAQPILNYIQSRVLTATDLIR